MDEPFFELFMNFEAFLSVPHLAHNLVKKRVERGRKIMCVYVRVLYINQSQQ